MRLGIRRLWGGGRREEPMENHDNGGSFTIETRHSIIGETRKTLSLEFVKIVNM